MSRDNVKEMARVMCGRDKDCLLCPIQSPCLMRNCAELLNAEGYRKSADVAREIFEEIETAFDEMIEEATDQLLSARLECDVKAVKTMEYGIDVIRLVHRTLKKSLKKKYIGEDTNVLTNTEDGE